MTGAGFPLASRAAVDRRIDLVVMEPPGRLDAARAARYEEIGRTLEAIAGRPVRARHYVGLERLGGAPAILGGAAGTWDEHERSALNRLGEIVLAADAPLLGICGGMQLLAQFAGGRIETMQPATREELGFGPVEIVDDDDLLAGLPRRATVYHDHRDEIVELPAGFRVLARTEACAVQAVAALVSAGVVARVWALAAFDRPSGIPRIRRRS